MNRRALLAILPSIVLLSVTKARAQQGERWARIGVLMNGPIFQPGMVALRDGLAAKGCIEGSNLRVDVRSGAGEDIQRLQKNAAELVSAAPDVMLTFGTAATQALRDNAPGLPVVFISLLDPVGAGFVQSLSHPGGKMTGFTTVEFSMNGKWLELLKEMAPQTNRVSPIGNPDTIPYGGHLRAVETAAASLGVEVVAAPVHNKEELESAMNAIAREPGGGFIVLPDSFTSIHRDLIIHVAASRRVPAIYPYSFFTASGGLVSYGIDQASQFSQAAAYVDRILRGEKPADLPVQEPTRFELAVNLKTAKALGLTVPPSILVRAGEVIE